MADKNKIISLERLDEYTDAIKDYIDSDETISFKSAEIDANTLKFYQSDDKTGTSVDVTLPEDTYIKIETYNQAPTKAGQFGVYVGDNSATARSNGFFIGATYRSVGSTGHFSWRPIANMVNLRVIDLDEHSSGTLTAAQLEMFFEDPTSVMILSVDTPCFYWDYEDGIYSFEGTYPGWIENEDDEINIWAVRVKIDVNGNYEVLQSGGAIATSIDGYSEYADGYADVNIKIKQSPTSHKWGFEVDGDFVPAGDTYALSQDREEITLTAGDGTEQTGTVAQMVGATGVNNGQSGIVPAPSTSNAGSMLFGDGTWKNLNASMIISALGYTPSPQTTTPYFSFAINGDGHLMLSTIDGEGFPPVYLSSDGHLYADVT